MPAQTTAEGESDAAEPHTGGDPPANAQEASAAFKDLLMMDEFLMASAPKADVFASLSDTDAVFASCTDKDQLAKKASDVGDSVKDMKLVVAALKRSMKDVQGTQKQLQKAKERYDQEKARATAGGAPGTLQGRPNLSSLAVNDSDPPVIRGYKHMHGKREMLLIKNVEEAISKMDVGNGFILRKGRSVLSAIVKDQTVKQTLEGALEEFKKKLGETTVARFQIHG
ncbi:unnamed protein product [Symbiodinium sp. CCMP2592]|nr:unnamed protein product [Symbiodinium sp. CCMP2592]